MKIPQKIIKISLLQCNYHNITINRKIYGEIPGNSIARYSVNFCNFYLKLRENTWQFYCQHFPVNSTVYGHFYGNFPVKVCFLWTFAVFSCTITVNRKNEVKI